ncbi:MAG: FAD-dependent monooxygenase [Maritimibacter sp.]|nr:FAD-dependent monooxygenase [Maritimibacter sp.]
MNPTFAAMSALSIERDADIYPRALAITVNDWTMRRFLWVGLDDALKEGMDVTHSLRWINYAGNPLMRMGFPPSDMGHARSHAICKPETEKTLREGAAQFHSVSVRCGAEVTQVAQDDAGVTPTVKDLATGATGTRRVRDVLACDGGSSRTRAGLGIQLLGDTMETRWIVIDAGVKRWWPERHVPTFWSDRERPVADVALSMGNQCLEVLLGPDFVVLGVDCDPAEKLSAVEKARWEALGARFVALRSADLAAASEVDVIDIDGTLIAWLAGHGGEGWRCAPTGSSPPPVATLPCRADRPRLHPHRADPRGRFRPAGDRGRRQPDRR